MKKIALGLTAAAIASAAPAFALTHEVTGFWRVEGTMDNLLKGRDLDPDRFVDQRLRLKYTAGVNEYVKVVYFGELDFQWGDNAYNLNSTSRNDGGGIGGDQVNLETKNLYAEVKFPGTPLVATAGLQFHGDNYDWILSAYDATGLTLAAKTGIVSADLSWFKWLEGGTTGTKGDTTNAHNFIGNSRAEDDADVYIGRVALTPVAGLKAGADLYYYRNQGSFQPLLNQFTPLPFSNRWLGAGEYYSVNREDLYFLGLNGSYKAGPFSVGGWFLYNWGTIDTTIMNNNGTTKDWTIQTPSGAGYPAGAYTESVKAANSDDFSVRDQDVKVGGYAASVKADLTVGGVNAFLRGVYFSDAGSKDNKVKSMFNPLAQGPEVAPFLRDGIFMIMVADLYGITYPGTSGFAMTDAASNGYGLTGVMAAASFVPPALKDFYVKGGLGYFRANSKDRGYAGERDGKTIGTEAAARVGYKFAGGAFDLSLNGAYAWLGNFYNNTVAASGLPTATNPGAVGALATGPDDPDNAYRLYLMANVPF